jgi:hypothetical protein
MKLNAQIKTSSGKIVQKADNESLTITLQSDGGKVEAVIHYSYNQVTGVYKIETDR